jgi:hypothetical protein
MSENSNRPSRSPAATATDIEACEAAIGARLPDWLRQRLALENGWEVDDRAGHTREEWRFLPVLDRTDRKRRVRTAEDIAWHTQQLRQSANVPAGAVVVARAWSPTTRLILLPDAGQLAVLGEQLWLQNGVAQPLDKPVDPAALGYKPKPGKDSRLRPADELPDFLYHPDPVATGAIRPNHALVCPCCELQTGWVYESEPYGPGAQPSNLCPWCIANGKAAAKFGAEFVSDIEGDVPAEVAEVIMKHTPGFVSWQGERWLTHCNDAAVFLGTAGWDHLKDLPDAQAAIVEDGWGEDALPLMTKDGDLCAYLFQCRHCKIHLAYADAC